MAYKIAVILIGLDWNGHAPLIENEAVKHTVQLSLIIFKEEFKW
nr:MAG TPA: hypothetical protein [Caudoviricetes sp.]